MTWLLLGLMAAAVGYGVMGPGGNLPHFQRIFYQESNGLIRRWRTWKTIKSEMHSVQEAQELVDSDQEMITEMQQEIAIAQRKLQELVNMESRLEMKMYKSEFKANKNR